VGTPKYATVNGHSYKYYTGAESTSTSVLATTWILTTNGSAPAGYMGANSILFKSGFGAYASRDWAYSSSTASSFTRGCGNSYSSGNYAALGRVRFYNGSGYNEYAANTSPYLTVGVVAAPQDQNLLQESLNGWMTSKSNDEVIHIPAVGTNGRTGYILSTDLDRGFVPSTPEEADAYTLGQPDVRFIPVYGEYGVTVVDQFPVYGGSSEIVIWN
jgi:hypothetical protein